MMKFYSQNEVYIFTNNITTDRYKNIKLMINKQKINLIEPFFNIKIENKMIKTWIITNDDINLISNYL